MNKELKVRKSFPGSRKNCGSPQTQKTWLFVSPMCWRGEMMREKAGEGKERDRGESWHDYVWVFKGSSVGYFSLKDCSLSETYNTESVSLHHTVALLYCQLLKLQKLKNTFINRLSDSRVLFYNPFYSEFNWHFVEEQAVSCKS